MDMVLVIDDNADAAESLAMLLDLQGHDTQAVTSGFAAFHHISEFTPEVCLIDIRMPGMDGYQVAARLRELLGQRARLLAVTGKLTAATDPRATVFEKVLAKPVDLGELLTAVAAPAC